MFQLNKYLKDNLISGYHNEAFTIEQVVIFAQNYLNKAQLTQVDIDEIHAILYEVEDEPVTLPELEE